MEEVIRKEWENIIVEHFYACIKSSMPKQCKLDIFAQGGFIKY